MTRDAETLIAVVRDAGGADPLDLNRAFFVLKERDGWRVRRWNRALVAALESGAVTVHTDEYDDPWIVVREPVL